MKSNRKLILFALVLFLILNVGCSNENPVSAEDSLMFSKYGNGGGSTFDLSQEEIDGLIHMRLEEKLARDVYTNFGNLYNYQVFLNIKKSEQKHMDAMLRLLLKYNIEDPVLSDEVGIFPPGPFQVLYDDFITQGSVSLLEALQVGVDIEGLDITDLQYQIDEVVDNPDILRVYAHLLTGSENHLAAFNRCIASLPESDNSIY
jgi:hypothetical protein